MSSLRQLEAVETITPEFETIDQMVRSFHGYQQMADGDTLWLKPSPLEAEEQARYATLTKIALRGDDWNLLTFQRLIGDYGFHYQSVGKRYYSVGEDIFRNTIKIGRRGRRPVVAYQEQGKSAEYQEVFSHLVKSWPISSWRPNFEPNLPKRPVDPQESTRKRVMGKGALLMRLAEHWHLQESPKVNYS